MNLEYLLLTDPTVRNVVIGTMLIAGCSAIVGCFTFLRKRALIGDALSHSILPGVCLSYMIFHDKSPVYLLVGAMISGWISLLCIDYIIAKTKIKADSAIGLNLSIFFGFGILLLTSIQHTGDGNQSGLDKFLFGKAAAIVQEDLNTFSILAILIILIVVLFYKEFKLISFDINFARTMGIPVRWLEFLLSSLTVAAVAIGIQTVGMVLMAAMLITPASAARFWTYNLIRMFMLASLFGAISAYLGTYVSYVYPSMPTGPWIVLVASMIAIFSLIFAPKTGLLSKYLIKRSLKLKMAEDNMLKLLYKLGTKKENVKNPTSIREMVQVKDTPASVISTGLERLRKKKLVVSVNDQWSLTDNGVASGMRLVKIHRLWEVYLTRYLHLASDHVHDSAETIEHIITPELEQKLEEMMNFPQLDPHNQSIPYKGQQQ